MSDIKENVALCEDYHLAIHHIQGMEEHIKVLETKAKEYEKIFEDFKKVIYNHK